MRYDDDDEDSEDSEFPARDHSQCPYCASTDSCKHVLVVLDRTYREALGGTLHEAFKERWSNLLSKNEHAKPERRESELFDELREEVDGLATAYDEYDFEGMPGGSSTYEVYYIQKAVDMKLAVRRFDSGD